MQIINSLELSRQCFPVVPLPHVYDQRGVSKKRKTELLPQTELLIGMDTEDYPEFAHTLTFVWLHTTPGPHSKDSTKENPRLLYI